jgi:hypothetical protein
MHSLMSCVATQRSNSRAHCTHLTHSGSPANAIARRTRMSALKLPGLAIRCATLLGEMEAGEAHGDAVKQEQMSPDRDRARAPPEETSPAAAACIARPAARFRPSRRPIHGWNRRAYGGSCDAGRASQWEGAAGRRRRSRRAAACASTYGGSCETVEALVITNVTFFFWQNGTGTRDERRCEE